MAILFNYFLEALFELAIGVIMVLAVFLALGAGIFVIMSAFLWIRYRRTEMRQWLERANALSVRAEGTPKGGGNAIEPQGELVSVIILCNHGALVWGFLPIQILDPGEPLAMMLVDFIPDNEKSCPGISPVRLDRVWVHYRTQQPMSPN
ncbi:MAG: hypothetical protein HYV77_03015 [Candidatus Wildermuthbacteria bacterium]|nr:hypothetical protein [Candidatus Wildermuthbacteria bacterium]